jgi:hypothetical protein
MNVLHEKRYLFFFLEEFKIDLKLRVHSLDSRDFFLRERSGWSMPCGLFCVIRDVIVDLDMILWWIWVFYFACASSACRIDWYLTCSHAFVWFEPIELIRQTWNWMGFFFFNQFLRTFMVDGSIPREKCLRSRL